VSRCQFIQDHRDAFGVKRLCEVLEVARSSFNKWRAAAPARAARERADQELAELIAGIHVESGGTYGAPRITAELRRVHGMEINEKKVARVMRKFGIAGFRKRRKHVTTVADPDASPVPDLFQRDFTADAPNTKYMGDITYLPVGDGEFLYLYVLWNLRPTTRQFAYCRDQRRFPPNKDSVDCDGGAFHRMATVLDCFSRRVVGWSITGHMRTELVADALSAAAALRGGLDGAIFHSDHGAQYTSAEFASLCAELGVVQSMGAVGTSADNAACESFHASLKREILQDRHRWASPQECRREVFAWLVRYNSRRRHSTNGQVSPLAYEQSYSMTLAA
jgi:transposase InsO family protein